MRRSRTLVLLGLIVALAACAPADDSALLAEFDELRDRLIVTETRLEEVESALQQRERRRVGMEQDIRRLSEQRVRAAADGAARASVAAAEESDDTGDETPMAGSSEPALAFNAFLETDEGTRALADAMGKYQAKRDAERSKRVVSALVKPFAEKAYLSQDQAERMSETLETAAQNIRDAWSSMRDIEPEERAQAIQKNIARTMEIRRETDESIQSMLNASQFEMYEADRATLLGVPGGPPRRNDDEPNR